MSYLSDQSDLLRTRVLLVDGNEDFRLVAADFLQRHQNLVLVGAVDASDQALMQAQGLRPDLILIDLDMGALHGVESIPRLRCLMPRASIIALSLWKSSAHRQATLAAGVDEIVSKADLTTDLLPAIRRVMQLGRACRGQAGTMASPSSSPGDGIDPGNPVKV